VPYLLIGILGAEKTMLGMTKGMFPNTFTSDPHWIGAVPPWLSGLVVCLVVLAYVFAGGSRSAAWANTFQTLVFMGMGVLAFVLISSKLGGLQAAIQQANPEHLVRTPSTITIGSGESSFTRQVGVPPLMFLSYMFIPLSVGMFPHIFQHWLTARDAKSFKLTVIMHPICIMIVWVPCVLLGVWATGTAAGMPPLTDDKVGAVLSIMVAHLIHSPVIIGLVTAGILAAVMSSLDSQFLCLGSIFTNDIVLHRAKPGTYNDQQTIAIARSFVVAVVALTYGLSLIAPKNIFDLAIWSFSGFAALTPVVFAALYWKRATKAGAYASIAAASLTWLWFFHLSGYGGEYAVGGQVMPVALCFAAAALAMLVVSLLTKPPHPDTVRKFFPN
jgi:SSS family solute:Na+ symporter